MDYIELSERKLEEQINKLSVSINEDYTPDVVLFVSKGAYSIGRYTSDYFRVPLLEVFAVRKGNQFKSLLSPILKIIPKNVKVFLREKEINSGYHNKNTSRDVYLSREHEEMLNGKYNFLIVDDSVDTGYTVKEIYTYLSNKFSRANIRFMVLNKFSESENVFEIDYFLYENKILIGPWSKDSKDHPNFIREYNKAKKRGFNNGATSY